MQIQDIFLNIFWLIDWIKIIDLSYLLIVCEKKPKLAKMYANICHLHQIYQLIYRNGTGKYPVLWISLWGGD